MNGVFLQGGGAKGAFQAGALYGLHKRGIRFQMASGTSIGAVNLYFLLTGNIVKMKEVWTNVEVPKFDHDYSHIDKVIDNEPIIGILRDLEDRKSEIKKAYVNYVIVDGCSVYEKEKEIVSLDKRSRLQYVKYSSLLPIHRNSSDSKKNIIEKFDSKKVFEVFNRDVENGIYEGYRLDGGIKNNIFMEPFLKNPVEKLYLIVFQKDFNIPEEIERTYGEKLFVISPPHDFESGDTLRFEREFCKRWFEYGEMAARGIGL
jgi:hypothetical protein